MREIAEPEYHFHGSHFEIGKLHGASLRERIAGEMRTAWEALSQGSPLGWEGYMEAFHRRHHPWVQRLLPRALEEVAGLAEGAGLNFAEAFFAAFHGGAAPLGPSEECTAFYCGRAATRGRRIYLGQTKDTPTPPERYVTMRLDYREGPHAVLLNYPGWVANIGMTSHGIAFTGNARYAAPGGLPGHPLSLLKKAILEARSLEQIRTLAEAGPWQDGALLVADCHGGAFCAEFIQGRAFLHCPGEGVFAHSNTVLAPAAAASDTSPQRSPSAASRLRAARAFLERRAPFHDVESLRALTRDHDGAPLSICLHPSGRYHGSTTAAMLVELDAGRVHVAVGQPCRSPFAVYRVPAQA